MLCTFKHCKKVLSCRNFMEIFQSIYNYGIKVGVFHKVSKALRKNKF